MNKFALCLLAALLLAGPALAQDPGSQGSGTQDSAAQEPAGRIVFVTLQGRLATIDPDGSELRILTPPELHFQFPAWSPGGSTVAAIGSSQGLGAVYLVTDSDDAELRQLYSSRGEVPIYLSWSPGGDTVSFIANHPEGFGLHLASPQGGATRLLTTGAPFFWQWTPDSQGLFIHTGFAGPNARLGFTSTGQDDLQANLAEPGFFQAPGISPSGRYIAYAELLPSGGSRLVVQNNPRTDAASVRRELPHLGLVAFSWHPERDLLGLISPTEEIPAFYGPVQLLDADTGLLETLAESTAVAFFWSPDGRYLVYFTPVSSRGDDVAESGRGSELFAMAGRTVMQTVQQGDLLLDVMLVDLAARTERLLATVAPSPLFVGQFLPFFDQYALSHSIWSPSGDALVLPVLIQGLPHIAVVGLNGTVTPLATGDMPSWSQP